MIHRVPKQEAAGRKVQTLLRLHAACHSPTSRKHAIPRWVTFTRPKAIHDEPAQPSPQPSQTSLFVMRGDISGGRLAGQCRIILTMCVIQFNRSAIPAWLQVSNFIFVVLALTFPSLFSLLGHG